MSVAAVALAAPAPQESPAAEAYVHEEIAAEPYVHTEIAAEPYVHEEIAAEPYVAPVAAPVVYAGYPYVYAGYPHVAYAAYHTGCVNSVGSVVPCAQ